MKHQSALFTAPRGRLAAIEDLHAATAIYTTAQVVDTLLDRLDWPGAGGRLLDPSAGDGSFIIQALHRIDVTDPVALKRICGWEIHAGAARSARIRITEHLARRGWAWPEASAIASRILINRDFLTEGPALGEFRVIAGNPPYLRFQRLPDYFKTLYGDCLPKYARGDLLHAFLDYCSKILPDDGVMGLVCSDRVLFNANAAQLRSAIGIRLRLDHVARLDPSTSFYRPKRRVRGSLPRIHPVEIVMSREGLFAITADAISPDGFIESPVTRTLGSVAKVSLAPWLGPVGIFVVSGKTAAALRRGKAELIPAIDTDDINPQTDELGTPTRYAIRTYPDQKPRAAVARHLLANIDRMPPRGRRRSYWLPPETINLDLTKQSLLIPRIARRLRVIRLPAGVLPLNHNLSIVSNSDMSLSDLSALLLSEKSQQWVARNSPRLENGFYSITTTMLRRMPI